MSKNRSRSNESQALREGVIAVQLPMSVSAWSSTPGRPFTSFVSRPAERYSLARWKPIGKRCADGRADIKVNAERGEAAVLRVE